MILIQRNVQPFPKEATSTHPPHVAINLNTCFHQTFDTNIFCNFIQSGASSPAKHGDAYFSSVYGSIQNPIAALRPYENQEP